MAKPSDKPGDKLSETIDYQAEGLFDGVEAASLDARRRLLDYLLDDEGVPLEDVKLAAKEKRLILLPVERTLGGEPVYVASEVAELADFELDVFLEMRRGLGLAEPALDQRAYSEYDVKVMRAVRANLAMGMPMAGIKEIIRVLGSALSQLAATVERQFLTTFLRPEDDEYDIAVRYAEVARITSPEFGFVLQHLFNLHLREATRVDVLGNEAMIDLLSDTREMAVCFADLVGFTSLGEQIRADELGSIAERLSEITIGVVQAPVRLIKTIGDAVMLVSPEPDALIDMALALIEAVDREEEGFPQLSVGLAVGEVLVRGGDVYGPPVNHASRLCDVARPGSVVTSAELHDRFDRKYDWTEVGKRRFKGIEQPIEIFRVRPRGGREREKTATKAREKAEQERKRAERERDKAVAAAEKQSEKAVKQQDKLAKGLERELRKKVEQREKAAAKVADEPALVEKAKVAVKPIAATAAQVKDLPKKTADSLKAAADSKPIKAAKPKLAAPAARLAKAKPVKEKPAKEKPAKAKPAKQKTPSESTAKEKPVKAKPEKQSQKKQKPETKQKKSKPAPPSGKPAKEPKSSRRVA
ncbi:MAG: hypothetical protein HY827_05070 [Actinobacteria bacterium]|nr:hypothetical protein [Actinomycetota bacterium]